MLPTGIRRSFNPIASACEQGVELTLQLRHNERDGVLNHSRRKSQSSESLAFVRGTHRWPVNSSHKGPVMRKMFPFVDVIVTRNCRSWSTNVRIPLSPTTKIRMARVTLSFDLLTGKWSSPMGYVFATNEYNPWNRRRHSRMTLRI